MTLSQEDQRLVRSARNELRIWRYLRWVWLAAFFGIFYYWMTLFDSLSLEKMLIREVNFWRQAVILGDFMLGMWLFMNWNSPKERLIARLADQIDNGEHDTD